jgi:1L-myo-inositol 1-phosphate cytidylyltransferase
LDDSPLRAIAGGEVSVSVVLHVPAVATRTVRDALVLAAGNGDRFKNASSESKLLQPVLGRPLILRTLQTAREAGITTFHVVLGYRARALRALIEANVPAGSEVRFLYNPDWQLENGLSVLAARRSLRDRRFALLMGDHLFDASALARLLRTPVHGGESLLAVDSTTADPAIVAEATKVKLSGARITSIGKDLRRYDALDTGLFVCDPSLFHALDLAVEDGDTTLSAGIRRLAEKGAMRAVDVAGASWFDIDTVTDLETAESQLSASRAEAV